MNNQEQPPVVDVQPEALPHQDPFTVLLAHTDCQDANIQELALALQRLYQHAPAPAPAPAAAPVDPPVPQVRSNFRLPAIKPLPFSGVYGNKPALKIQNLIDNYLERSYEFCLLHCLASSTTEISHPDQPTYVQFVTGGLSDAACAAWCLFSQHECTHMTWEDYTKWVMMMMKMKFRSRLSLDQALDALDELHQTTSASAYSAKFNNLVSSISVAGTKFSPKHICSHHRKNLKDHLKALTDLVKINDNLMLLQQQAEYLNDIAFCSTGKSGHKNIMVTATSCTNSQSFDQPKAIPSKTPFLTPLTLWTLGTLSSKPPRTHASRQNKKHSSDPKDGAFIAKPKTMTLTTAPSSRTIKPSSPPSLQQELTMPQLKPKVRKTVKTTTKPNRFAPLAFEDPPDNLTAVTVPVFPVQVPRPKLPLYHVKSEHHAPYSDTPGLLICQGTIDDHPVSILIDSGANPSFIHHPDTSAQNYLLIMKWTAFNHHGV
ncbi:hypothetical protein CcCBS67573_g07445 [Chytriomyces confervae]|uniref:Retrotransposon gag domain-containing protein n=1 Tax=Chytriomyces confervae TaxID=246404 RepID=A0A507EUT1_9FUNG|nr:hypothetical protein CcCBS67573_g07445 [Chytriomyces confervae]